MYGVEMGAYVALRAGTRDQNVRALVLDSIPSSPTDILNSAVTNRTGLSNNFLKWLARGGTRIYFMGNYEDTPSCEVAAGAGERRILLLAGEGPGDLRQSTQALVRCLPAGVEISDSLPLTGYNLPSATGQQGEAYDRRVIDFLDKALR